VDATDNVATRYLINDYAVKHEMPWVHGAAIGVEGRLMVIRPGGPCLRCVYPNPPAPGELGTCETAGVLGAAPATIAAMQSAAVIRLLTDDSPSPSPSQLIAVDVWEGRFRTIAVERDADCPCCGGREFPFLETYRAGGETALCGRNAVQVSPTSARKVDLNSHADRLARVGAVQSNRFFVKVKLNDPPGIAISLFADGRAIIHGTTSPERAKSLYSRYIGD
jgi:hypothetical protein